MDPTSSSPRNGKQNWFRQNSAIIDLKFILLTRKPTMPLTKHPFLLPPRHPPSHKKKTRVHLSWVLQTQTPIATFSNRCRHRKQDQQLCTASIYIFRPQLKYPLFFYPPPPPRADKSASCRPSPTDSGQLSRIYVYAHV